MSTNMPWADPDGRLPADQLELCDLLGVKGLLLGERAFLTPPLQLHKSPGSFLK